MKKSLAVIITTCNRPYLLKNLVSQIKPQLGDDDTIIIVNDGDEGSVHKLGLDYPTILHCKDYYAVSSARNMGMKTAINMGYDWGVFVDDDVILSDNWLKRFRQKGMDKNTVYAGKITTSEDEKIDCRANEGTVSKFSLVDAGGCNFCVHLPSLSEVGGYDEDFDGKYGCEDLELMYRLLIKEDWDLKYLPEAKMINLQAPPSEGYRRDYSSNREVLEDKISEEYIWWN